MVLSSMMNDSDNNYSDDDSNGDDQDNHDDQDNDDDNDDDDDDDDDVEDDVEADDDDDSLYECDCHTLYSSAAFCTIMSIFCIHTHTNK